DLIDRDLQKRITIRAAGEIKRILEMRDARRRGHLAPGEDAEIEVRDQGQLVAIGPDRAPERLAEGMRDNGHDISLKQRVLRAYVDELAGECSVALDDELHVDR